MAAIFRIRMEDDQIALLKDKAKIREAYNAVTTGGPGRAFSEGFQGFIKELLSPGHRFKGAFPVGASGKASENIELRQYTEGDGVAYWEVYEGTKTDANRIIRTGVPRGTKPTIQEIRLWASHKKLTFSNKSKTKAKPFIRQKSRKGKVFARAFPGTKSEANTFAYIVRQLIYKYGSYRRKGIPTERAEGHNWMNTPDSKGAFNYPRYALNLRKPSNIVGELGNDSLNAVVQAMLYGRKFTNTWGAARKFWSGGWE